jgi:hypothetical protein
VAYDDVVADVVTTVTGLAERAVSVGVRRDGVLIDAAHDFGKNTYHSLEVTRRLGELVATGWPVLVAVSNKKFLGETLDVDKDNRLEATLATTALCSWAGGRVFRAHQVAATRRVLDTVASIAGTRPRPCPAAPSPSDRAWPESDRGPSDLRAARERPSCGPRATFVPRHAGVSGPKGRSSRHDGVLHPGTGTLALRVGRGRSSVVPSESSAGLRARTRAAPPLQGPRFAPVPCGAAPRR